MRHLRQTGDTIVEVLIAMAVASLVLGGAYALTSRTLANARQAQEHSEALKIAQEQIERLKVMSDRSPLASSNKCIAATGNATTTLNDCRAPSPVNYVVRIEYTPSNGINPEIYNAVVTWSGVTGNAAPDRVEQAYRGVN